MSDFLTMAVGSMQLDMNTLNSVAHNIANSATPGFKRVFAAMSNQEAGANQADPTQGALTFTGSNFDLALEGEGFFLVTRDALGKELLSRGGTLALDERSRLVLAQSGLPVLDVAGNELLLDNSEFKLSAQGAIIQQGRAIGQLKINYLPAKTGLEALGNGLYRALGRMQPSDQVEQPLRIRQGFVERSNVNSSAQMVQMMQSLRHFESVQKSVQAMDAIWDKAIRTLGEY